MFESVYIDALGLYLPESLSVDDAVRAGLMTPQESMDWDWSGVCVAGAIAPSEMAVIAGRDALGGSGVPRDAVDLVVHTGSYVQGGLGWPVHSYVQRNLVGERGTAFELKQLCSGGLTSIQVAASMLSQASKDGVPHAAIVTGADNNFWFDRFEWVRFHRSLGARGLLTGDAAHAVVLSTSSGCLRIIAAATSSTPEFEELRRRPGNQFPVPLAVPTEDEWREIGAIDPAIRSWVGGLAAVSIRRAHDLVAEVIAEAGIAPSDVRWCLPAIGTSEREADMLAGHTGVEVNRHYLGLGRQTGHLSVSDHVLAIAALVQTAEVKPGDRVILLANGYGATSACLLLEVASEPEIALDRRVRIADHAQ